MVKKICICLILCLVQISQSKDFLDLDWNITGSGSRSSGMGGAFIGLADDATAINWNPGGLTALEHLEASVVASSTFDNENYSSKDNDDWNDSYDITYSHITLDFLSIAYPLMIKDKKLVLAAAFQKQLDFFSEDKGQDFEDSSEGNVYTANISGSYQFTPYLSAGFTANYWMGSAEYDYWTEWNESVEYFDDFNGFNFVLGGMFDFSGISEDIPLKIGAVLKTPFDLKFDYTFEDYMDGNLEEDGSSEFTVQMPLMFGIGASYRFGDNFTLSVDFEKRNYGKSKVILKDSEAEMNMSATDEDMTQYRIGMEYLIVTDNLIIPVRCGFFNYPTLWANEDYLMFFSGDYDSDGSPLYNEEDSISDKEQLVGYGISLGSGIIFDNFALDVSYTVINYESMNTYLFNDGPLEGYDVEYKYSTTKSNLKLSSIIYLDSFGK